MDEARQFTHADIDRRIRRLVEACARKIDADPALLIRAKEQLPRWSEGPLKASWERLLLLPWSELRERLLEDSERGDQLRQSVPFGGFLAEKERMAIIRDPGTGPSH